MPFGLTNAPATFMSTMNSIFHNVLDESVVVFLDDILVYSKTLQDHAQHLQQTLQILRDNQFYGKLSKCEFCSNSIEFLGHIITPDGIAPDPKKIKAVTDWPVPTSVSDVRSFLGFVNFYKRFIEQQASIAVPLTNLTKKDVPFIWSPSCQQAFDTLKTSLTTAPVLALPHPDPQFPFHISIDASKFALGCTLSQDTGTGLRPIAFESRKLNSAEQNYGIYDREALALVHAVKTWRHYIDGRKCYVDTDHAALKYILTQGQISNSRQARWMKILQPFDLELSYKSGKTNPSDPLSRRPDLMCSAISSVSSSLTSQFTSAYASDPFFSSPSLASDPAYSFQSPFWIKKSRVCVPDSSDLKLTLLREHHDSITSGHFGTDKTLSLLSRTFTWNGMARDVRAYVRSCDTCQRVKPSTQVPAGLLQPLPIPDKKWESVSLDFIVDLPKTPSGFDAILVVIDRLSKMAHFIPTHTNASAPQIANLFISHIFRYHGLPKSIISDRDKLFTSKFWTSLFRSLGTSLQFSTAYHPKIDGQTERTNRTLISAICAFINPHHTNWDSLLPSLEFAYNNSSQRSTHETPFFLNYGQHPISPATFTSLATTNPASAEFLQTLSSSLQTAKENLQKAQQQQSSIANRHRRLQTFNLGDQVLLSTKNLPVTGATTIKKFSSRFIGPFSITQVVSNVSYRLQLPATMKIHPIFHVSLLKPYHNPSLVHHSRIPTPPDPLVIHGEKEYFVEAILDTRLQHNQRQYLVKWLHYPSYDNTWEPEGNLSHCKEKIAEFRHSLTSQKKKKI